MDPKMTVALEKVLSKYPGRSQLNFSDPFMWAGAIHYIVTHWHGQPLTHEDIRLAIANHIIMRINRTSRSQPYNTQQRLNTPQSNSKRLKVSSKRSLTKRSPRCAARK